MSALPNNRHPSGPTGRPLSAKKRLASTTFYQRRHEAGLAFQDGIVGHVTESQGYNFGISGLSCGMTPWACERLRPVRQQTASPGAVAHRLLGCYLVSVRSSDTTARRRASSLGAAKRCSPPACTGKWVPLPCSAGIAAMPPSSRSACRSPAHAIDRREVDQRVGRTPACIAP
jgi:hypothetical protein